MESSRSEILTVATIASAASRLSAAPTPQDPAAFTIKQASDLLRRKSLSPVDLTQACLQRIEQLNPRVNAYITVTRDQALASARQAAEEQRQGKWRGPHPDRAQRQRGFAEPTVLALAHAYEQATPWHNQRPNL